MFSTNKTVRYFVLLIALVVLVGIALWQNTTFASGYGYESDVDRQATLKSAARIVRRQGGYFVSPEMVRDYFNASVRVPRALPFTERQLFDCGRCILFPTVSEIGHRGVPTSINNLWRAPEAKELFNRIQSLSNPWFKREQWADVPLRDGWHLVNLEVRDKGRAIRRSDFYANEEPPRPNVAFWLLLLLPPEEIAGEYFYTGTTVFDGKSLVIFGRTQPGTIVIDHTPREFGNLDVGRITEIVP